MIHVLVVRPNKKPRLMIKMAGVKMRSRRASYALATKHQVISSSLDTSDRNEFSLFMPLEWLTWNGFLFSSEGWNCLLCFSFTVTGCTRWELLCVGWVYARMARAALACQDGMGMLMGRWNTLREWIARTTEMPDIANTSAI